MLIHPTVERLRALGLSAMADAFIELQNTPDAAELSREDWFGLLVDREATSRDNKRLARRLRDAKLRQAYRVENGSAVASDDPIDDFTVENLGVQLRYRFEFRPLSYLYVVYGRGGYREEPVSDTAGSLVRNSFELRDNEQLLIKFSYRFED